MAEQNELSFIVVVDGDDDNDDDDDEDTCLDENIECNLDGSISEK